MCGVRLLAPILRSPMRLNLRDLMRAPTAHARVSDAMLLLCAKCLAGEIVTSTPVSDGSLMSFLFPVRIGAAAGARAKT